MTHLYYPRLFFWKTKIATIARRATTRKPSDCARYWWRLMANITNLLNTGNDGILPPSSSPLWWMCATLSFVVFVLFFLLRHFFRFNEVRTQRACFSPRFETAYLCLHTQRFDDNARSTTSVAFRRLPSPVIEPAGMWGSPAAQTNDTRKSLRHRAMDASTGNGTAPKHMPPIQKKKQKKAGRPSLVPAWVCNPKAFLEGHRCPLSVPRLAV